MKVELLGYYVDPADERRRCRSINVADLLFGQPVRNPKQNFFLVKFSQNLPQHPSTVFVNEVPFPGFPECYLVLGQLVSVPRASKRIVVRIGGDEISHDH